MGEPDELSIERKLKQELNPLRIELDVLDETITKIFDEHTTESTALIRQLARNTTLFERIKTFIEEELRTADKHPELYTEDMILKNVQAYEQVNVILNLIKEWKTLCPPEEIKQTKGKE